MVMLQPEARIGDEERRHLPTSIIIDAGAPILVVSLTRIRMLIKVSPVELKQAVRIVGKVAWHPVENQPDPRLMGRIDESCEILRRSKAAGRRIEGDRLIAPGTIE